MPSIFAGTYSSPHKTREEEVGCYKDIAQQAMPNWVLGNKQSSFQQCKHGSINKRYAYFALQDVRLDYKGVCFTSNDIDATKQCGAWSNCTRDPVMGKRLGLNDANFVYQLL